MKRTISAPEPEQAPSIDWDECEKFARDALRAFSAGDDPDAVVLALQLADAELVELDYTGAGFFLTLGVRSDAPLLRRNGVMGDVQATTPAADNPLGLLLFVEDGAPSTLEAFAYGDWPADLSAYRMHYISWRKLPEGGATAVNALHRDPHSMWDER